MPHGGARQFIQKLPDVACVAGGILVPRVLFWWRSHHTRQAEKLQGIFVSGARENPACHISYEFWMPCTFVILFGTIW